MPNITPIFISPPQGISINRQYSTATPIPKKQAGHTLPPTGYLISSCSIAFSPLLRYPYTLNIKKILI